MASHYPITEARANFRKIVESAENGSAVEVTRHGETVAVIVSASQYRRLTGTQRSMASLLDELDEDFGQDGVESDCFDGLRSKDTGRAMSFE